MQSILQNTYLCIMAIINTQTQMRKGILEYCILSIISRGEIYASDIIAELKRAKLLVVEGTLYPLLTRLKNNGLLSYVWRESNAGPPRKYYEITTEGREVLRQLDTTWKELVFAVETALDVRHTTSVSSSNDSTIHNKSQHE